MKTVRSADGLLLLERVSDDKAKQLVDDAHTHTYAKKQEWKTSVRDLAKRQAEAAEKTRQQAAKRQQADRPTARK